MEEIRNYLATNSKQLSDYDDINIHSTQIDSMIDSLEKLKEETDQMYAMNQEKYLKLSTVSQIVDEKYNQIKDQIIKQK